MRIPPTTLQHYCKIEIHTGGGCKMDIAVSLSRLLIYQLGHIRPWPFQKGIVYCVISHDLNHRNILDLDSNTESFILKQILLSPRFHSLVSRSHDSHEPLSPALQHDLPIIFTWLKGLDSAKPKIVKLKTNKTKPLSSIKIFSLMTNWLIVALWFIHTLIPIMNKFS